jgi:hypothetical protein
LKKKTKQDCMMAGLQFKSSSPESTQCRRFHFHLINGSSPELLV